jgi:hypothetical protein
MNRRWPRFSVRSLLVLVTVSGLVLGAYTIFVRSHFQAYHREQATIAQLQDLEAVVSVFRRPRGPAWFQKWKGGIYSHRVVELQISCRVLSKELFAKLTAFGHLESLTINGNKISDQALAQLAPIRTLRSLSLRITHMQNSGQHALRQLRLELLELITDHFGTNETNWIEDLNELKQLELTAPVADSDLKSLEPLPNLEELAISSKGVTDAGLVHLARFPNLRKLTLGCPVSDAGMVHLIPLKRLERLVCCPDGVSWPMLSRQMMSVRAKYHQTPLVDAVRVMSQITQAPLRIDEAALQAAGIATGSIMLTVDERCDLRQALDAMLAPHALVCIQIHDPDGLLITTGEEAARRRPGTTRLLEALPKLAAYVPW